MKYKSFLAAALVIVIAAASCGTKKQSVNEQLIGVWAGIDTIQIVTYDTLGNLNIETIAVPVAIEYFADTTMNGKVKYNDSTMANIDAVVLVGEPYISYTGVMNVNDAKQHINGELFYQENPESLTMEFFSKDPATGAEHRGKGILKRQMAK
ncbi:MAG: hypothetical protein IKY70_06770 [Bacteroidales bacterium]|nr:hypothetical protein [Bacteroidales bacterium]